MRHDSIIYIPLQPQVDSRFREIEFREFCCELFDTKNLEATVAKFADELTLEISSNDSTLQKDKDYLTFLILKKVLLDLINQGWQLEVNDSKLGLSYPLFPDNSKELIRKRHSFERQTQLEKESIQKFILKMEANGIFSLIRDGKELVALLKKISLMRFSLTSSLWKGINGVNIRV